MDKLKVYLDNCCYNRPFDQQKQTRIIDETQAKLKIQELIKNGQIYLVSSYVLTFEVGKMSNFLRKEAIERFLKHTYLYIDQSYSKCIEHDANLFMKKGVKTFDAFHVACAIFANCDFFITTDDRILKTYDPRISIVNPITFMNEWRKQNEY